MAKKKTTIKVTKDMLKKQSRKEEQHDLDNSITQEDLFKIENDTSDSQYAGLIKLHVNRLIDAEEKKDHGLILTATVEIERLKQLMLEEKIAKNKAKE
jgi:hypothetical protein